jgi:chemotaxis protein histidine kinase CheA
MATVNKDFKIKSGLIVEGTTATVNGYDILTKKPADDQYIIDLIGGETLVKSVSNEFDVSVAGELSIDRATVDAYYDAAGSADSAEAAAIAAAALDATAKADAAEADAISAAASDATTKANAAQAAAEATASADATTKANAAQAAAEATASADATAKANAAQAAAEATASADATTKANAALASAEDYTDTAVANLVDSAPELLNTLNELAAALGDSPDTISNLTTLVGTKADSTYVDNQDVYYDGLAQGYASSAQSAAEATASADATSKANAAQAAAEATASADATSKANAAEAAAIAHADALTTDDVAEGTTQYFTDARAKTSAADLLTGATLSNITITGNGSGLTITAENGVAGSTTSDLAEGSNLYFTDARALDAISGSNIQPQSIDITWVRREEATWTDVATASKATCHSASTSEGSMKYLVRVTASVGGTRHSHVTEVLATVDGANGVAVVEYGTIYTSAEPLATVTVEWNASTSKYDLNVTTANNSSEVMVAATLLATLD